MKLRTILTAATALALFAAPAFADKYVGGAVMSSEMGGKTVLTGANGMTLYIFDKDKPGVSNCYDSCAINWPPLLADATAKPEGDFTIVDRTDGTKMLAYKGMPLYFWKNDAKAGDMTGDGVGGVWHLAVE